MMEPTSQTVLFVTLTIPHNNLRVTRNSSQFRIKQVELAKSQIAAFYPKKAV